MELFQTLIERWGFPVAYSVWLMITFTRELREIRASLARTVVLLSVIAKTLDVTDITALSTGTVSEGGK